MIKEILIRTGKLYAQEMRNKLKVLFILNKGDTHFWLMHDND